MKLNKILATAAVAATGLGANAAQAQVYEECPNPGPGGTCLTGDVTNNINNNNNKNINDNDNTANGGAGGNASLVQNYKRPIPVTTVGTAIATTPSNRCGNSDAWALTVLFVGGGYSSNETDMDCLKEERLHELSLLQLEKEYGVYTTEASERMNGVDNMFGTVRQGLVSPDAGVRASSLATWAALSPLAKDGVRVAANNVVKCEVNNTDGKKGLLDSKPGVLLAAFEDNAYCPDYKSEVVAPAVVKPRRAPAAKPAAAAAPVGDIVINVSSSCGGACDMTGAKGEQVKIDRKTGAVTGPAPKAP